MKVALGYTLGSANPYVSLLREGLSDAGVDVVAGGVPELARGDVDVWHVQWPTVVAQRSNPLHLVAGVGKLLLQIALCKTRRIAIVWTVHNLRSHEVRHPHIEAGVLTLLVRSLSGWIALSTEAAEEAVRIRPRLDAVPHWVIAHGDYRAAYPPPPSSSAARRELGISPDDQVLIHLGLIRDYKNVPDLIEAVRRHPSPRLRLIIAGELRLDDPAGFIDRLEGDDRIMLRPGFVPDAEVPLYFAAADLCVLPFSRVLNSGSALLSLSFDTPVLLPSVGSMPSLHRHLGDAWVTLFSGTLQPEDLDRGLLAGQRCGPEAPLDDYSWSRIARQTKQAYVAAANAKRGTPQ